MMSNTYRIKLRNISFTHTHTVYLNFEYQTMYENQDFS